MRIYACSVLLFSLVGILHGGESSPAWLKEQLSDMGVLTKPGVYPLKDSRLLGVGQGKVHSSLRDTYAQRSALNSAEHDAEQRIAKYLFLDMFEKYEKVSIKLRHATRVYEHPPMPDQPTAYVAIVVNCDDVSATPILDVSIILNAENVILPAAMLPYLEDPLLQLGGGRIYSYKDGWLVLGVGVAPLFGNDSLAERDAVKRARLEAGKALTETIFGSNFDVMEQEAELQIEHDGIASFRQWSSRRTRETIEGELKRALEIGSWYTDDDYVAIVMAVSDMPLESDLANIPSPQNGNDTSIPDYPDWEVEPRWEFALISYPRLLHGGAILYPDSDGLWGIGVGAAKLTGNLANDQINAPRAAEMDARRNLVGYLSGFSTKSDTVAMEEIESILSENGMESTEIIESLRKLTKEKTTGMIRDLQKSGTWKSLDRKLLYQMHVVAVDEKLR